jgi:aminoglycoside phosphotransferase (APT) family kinase protein
MLWSMFLPGFMKTFGPYLSTEAAELLERFGPRIAGWVDDRDPPNTVTHGDYRLDNLMFGDLADGATIATVDWQTPGHGLGITDVSYFLGAGVMPDVRRRIERDLVDQYCVALARYGVALDGEQLWLQYRRDAYAGIVMSVIASQIVGSSERSEAMFAAMATRHAQHALDLDSESLL